MATATKKTGTRGNVRPASKKPGQKKSPTEKKPHPSIGSTKPGVYPFTQAPADFDPIKHKPLRAADFSNKSLFFTYKAEMCDRQAEEYRRRAADPKSHSSTLAKRATKAKKLALQLAALREELSAGGVDFAALEREALAEVSDGETSNNNK